MDNYLDNTAPTIEEVRTWGFTENLYFIEQDEDLVLHSTEYIPILIELSSNENCLKKDYCHSTLTHYTQLQLALRNLEELQKINTHIKEYTQPITYKVKKWKDSFLFLYDLIICPREITIEQSEEIAFTLTVGDYCLRNFKKLRVLDSGFVEYLASTNSYQEYFYINPKTSFWKSSKHFPLY